MVNLLCISIAINLVFIILLYRNKKSMGNRRLGLGRLESLVEQLKRELALGSATLVGFKRAIEAKTDDYTVVEADSGKVLTTEGTAKNIVFTLPTPTTSLQGMWVEFINCADYEMKITGDAGKMILQGSITGNYIDIDEPNQLIGANAWAICTGTKWFVRGSAISVSHWDFNQ